MAPPPNNSDPESEYLKVTRPLHWQQEKHGANKGGEPRDCCDVSDPIDVSAK
jgi:hypothetical protein